MTINHNTLLNFPFEDIVQSYDTRDCILYALALGLGADPADRRQLRFVYEQNLAVFPTMATTLCFDGPWTVPNSGIDLSRVLHGEQSITMHRILPPAGTVHSREQITDIIDKGRDAIIYSRRDLADQSAGTCIATLESSLYCRGGGGFGGASKPIREITQPVPGRTPDRVVEMGTLPQTALLYRLSGDRCRLHVDPEFAQQAGFPGPILHGLCSFGIAAHATVRSYANYEVERLRSVSARFCAPVFPGETITVEFWLDDAFVSFRAWAKGRDVKVLDCGRALFE